MKQAQMILPLKGNKIYDCKSWIRDDFNAQATALIDKWPDWPWPKIVCINGDKACGKTHLSHIWAKKTGGIYMHAQDIPAKSPLEIFAIDLQIIQRHNACLAIDDIDQVKDEEWLFHFYNFIQEQKISALITAQKPPVNWGVKLSDLASRLTTVISIEINLPTDDALRAIMLKQFNDRGLIVDNKTIDYLLKHCDRSFDAIHAWTNILDEKAATEGRSVTIPLIREILQKTDNL